MSNAEQKLNKLISGECVAMSFYEFVDEACHIIYHEADESEIDKLRNKFTDFIKSDRLDKMSELVYYDKSTGKLYNEYPHHIDKHDLGLDIVWTASGVLWARDAGIDTSLQ